ncbi:helix-turn-helix transcriptional regulator [Aneurinibacillus sp. Ricciae_BoGa-3]|uniref:helix-turn-helix domain-containing protein n=1 Tax=Aneurinibacillus sp. Ricciae_BoGa-3 TaxID=3022697 RepID=UPI0023408CBA|nr:helix-turn-helix transcriptional regulator [Aneurinibacillus sp. Ricciae_BoGa-3]WCK56447.1 helix-turn-helix transcriptional regulator [Aneurinibacillus sp. Ricciae_BoGa-3]
MIKFSLDKIMHLTGLSEKEIIQITQLNPSTVKALISGKTKRIELSTLDKICSSLHVSPADLIEFTPSTPIKKASGE